MATVDGGAGGAGENTTAAGEAFARVVKPSEVLESLMNDGTFDGLRGKVTTHLKNNEELKQYTQSLVEKSQTLNSPGAENKTRRELFDALRRELEGPVLDRCSKSAWELILSKEGLGKEVIDSVEATYSKLCHQAETALQPESRTPSLDPYADKRTPSQERPEDQKSNGSNPQPEGREAYAGNKRDREQHLDRIDGAWDIERSREREREREYLERSRNRDRDLYERRDAAREFGGGEYSDSRSYGRDQSDGSRREYSSYDRARQRT